MTAKLKLGWVILVMLSAMMTSANLTPAEPPRVAWPAPHASSPALAASPVSNEQAALAEHLASKYAQPLALVTRIVRAVYQEAASIGLPPLLVLAIIEKESSLKPQATNPSGAVGLMQVVPRYHGDKLQQVMHPDGLRHPETNIRVGSRILAQYLEARSGNLEKALVAYSGNARDYYRRVKAFRSELEEVRSQALEPAAAPQR